MLLSVWAALAAPGNDAGIGLTARPFEAIEVARDARTAPPQDIAVRGPFRLVSAVNGVRAYEAPLPIRPRALFYDSAPEGMQLASGGKRLRYASGEQAAANADTWAVTASSLVVRVAAGAPRPDETSFVLRYPEAQKREDALFAASSGEKPAAEFAVRSVQIGDVTRQGLYLPAPSRAAWEVTVPEAGVFGFDLGIVPPEVDDGTRSDGADVRVEVDGVEVAKARAGDGFRRVEVDLAAFAGKTVRLAVVTEDADPTRDHVLLAGPAVYARKADPKRVLLVFVDTLRRDHLGLYGYERDTTPKIDAWAKDAVVFDEARSVAPWTLPSARSILSGLQPEHWDDAVTLPQRLAAAGFATGAFVGNVYLSSNFDMADGWDEHGCVNWPYGELEVDRALDFLDRHRDRDALLMVHLMDMHLPYKEPARYRGLFEGEAPAGLGQGFLKRSVDSASQRNKDAVRDYVVARYDQSLRYVDDEVARLLDAVGDDATVVFFADHGEEFFDHGDFEHGHTLYDELLRVPFVVKAPGAGARRVDAPVSLLDLTPTVLDLVGLDATGLEGRSLAGLVRGGDDPTLADRPLGFGRPLYGQERWGSLRGGVKYTTNAGEEHVYDLRADPGEHRDLRATTDPVPARAAMAAGLGRAVRTALRVSPKGAKGTWDAEIAVPAGIELAWAAEDPTKKASASVEIRDGTVAVAHFETRVGVQREVYVVPKGEDPVAALAGATVRLIKAGASAVPLTLLPFDGTGTPLAKAMQGGRALQVTWAAVPLPVGKAVSGFDAETKSALCALGYADCGEE